MPISGSSACGCSSTSASIFTDIDGKKTAADCAAAVALAIVGVVTAIVQSKLAAIPK